jgi:hypothetical protein
LKQIQKNFTLWKPLKRWDFIEPDVNAVTTIGGKVKNRPHAETQSKFFNLIKLAVLENTNSLEEDVE